MTPLNKIPKAAIGEKIGWAQEFSPLALQNIISPKWRENWEKIWDYHFGQTCPCAVFLLFSFGLCFSFLFFHRNCPLCNLLWLLLLLFLLYLFCVHLLLFCLFWGFCFHPFIFPHLFWFLLLFFFFLPNLVTS